MSKKQVPSSSVFKERHDHNCLQQKVVSDNYPSLRLSLLGFALSLLTYQGNV